MTPAELKERIRTIPDFPEKGVLFRDITTLLKDPAAFSATVDLLVDHYRPLGLDAVAAIESRGFIFGAPLAHRLGLSFIPVRKFGKLPAATARMEYELEYGREILEIHTDAVRVGLRTVVIDDLLATGGTSQATARLIESLGGVVVELAFVVELTYLKGRQKLEQYPVFSLIQFDT
ncbi:MAG: adenine phosphoribosyltransferase [Moorellales bacterium]